jgi:hypothetical protein
MKVQLPDGQLNTNSGFRPRARVPGGIAAVVLFARSAVVCAQTYFTPSTPGWTFSEETPVASGGFVDGPGTPSSGSPGSYQLTVQQPGGGLFYTQ